MMTAILAVILTSFAVVAIADRPLFETHGEAGHFANADDPPTVKLGKQVYMERCASCHGRYLQGQPLWQLVDENSHRRAPAHDQTGHTWLHGDESLFFMTEYGHFADVPGTATSAMPAFKGVLADQDILAVIAFIKARWPVGLRVLQAMRNPDQAGMPAGAEREDWTFPPDCQGAGQRTSRKSTAAGS
jgi:mono/diheme cytochrome c family protein